MATLTTKARSDLLGPRSAAVASTLEGRVAELETRLVRMEGEMDRSNRITLLVFSGDLDRVLASLMIATTAASMGMETTLYFTFWGLNALKERRVYAGKPVMERMIDLMTPTGPDHMGMSQMNMLGAGTAMFKRMMKDKEVLSADELLAIARESGARILACSLSMEVMGIRKEELAEGIEVGGAATYLGEACRSGVTLFI